MKEIILSALITISPAFVRGMDHSNPLSTKNVDVYVDHDKEGTNVTVVAIDPHSKNVKKIVKQAAVLPKKVVKPVVKTVVQVAKKPVKVVTAPVKKVFKKLGF